MKPIRFILTSALISALSYPFATMSEDIDLYSSMNAAGAPNLLLVMDTGAYFENRATVPCTAYSSGGEPSLGNTAGGVEQCALVDALESLADSTVNIGLLIYNSNNLTVGAAADVAPCVGDGGGCLVKPLTLMTAENKAALISFIKSWTTTGSTSATQFKVKTNNQKTGSAMQEAWAYYTGKIGMSGKDYPNTKIEDCRRNFIVYIANAFNSSASPGDPNPGPENTTTGLFSTQVGATEALKRKLTNTVKFPERTCGVTEHAAGTQQSNWSENWADEWARYMNETDLSTGDGALSGKQNIVTYTIGVIDQASCKPEYPALLSNMALYGGGKYFQVGNASEVKSALLSILNEVQAVNSVFASASLPVSVNTQGTYLNQIYMGMFRPAASARPRWEGNLKQYQFVYDAATEKLKLSDSSSPPISAISSAGTGFINPNAVSFWTAKNIAVEPDLGGGFWRNNISGASEGFDRADGEVVEKGGAAQRLRLKNLLNNYATTAGSTTNPRKLYTYCPGGTGCQARLTHPSNEFSPANNNITNINLGAPSTVTSATIINWIRGEDNLGGAERGPGSAISNVRPSIHGDVLHSRPLVLNYGGDSPKVVVFYGANDGVFRAVNGNQTESIGGIGGIPAGEEIWGLILPEHFPRMNRQRANSPELKFPTTSEFITPPPAKKDYFVDGPTGVYQKLAANGTTEKAIIYLTMRRGGRFIYALDVTDPADPRVLWTKGCRGTSVVCDTNYAEIGQTWSRPRVALLRGYVDAAGASKPVLIFGAGYAPEQDPEPHHNPPGIDTMGRGVFVVDAMTGAVVWSAKPAAEGATETTCSGTTPTVCSVHGMNYSIPSDITIMDRDFDGKIDRAYAADVGGNVWRIDFEPTAGVSASNWKVTKLAALGCDDGACAAETTPRKFLYPPSVVPVGAPGNETSYDMVMLGSGDREHPLYSTVATSSYRVQNRFYMLKDRATGKDAGAQVTITHASVTDGLFNATMAPTTDETTESATVPYDMTNDDRGFYFNFLEGEKAVNAPLTVGGVTYFGTNQVEPPSNTSCDAGLGTARGYYLDPFIGAYYPTVFDGGGFPPSPNSGIVTVGDTRREFCIGCVQPPTEDPPCVKSALENCDNPKVGKKRHRRTYWYRK